MAEKNHGRLNHGGLTALLAAGLLAGTAHAQSSLTISGLIDAGVYRDTDKDWRVGPIQPGNIKVSGIEDLGRGYAATFALSHRFDIGTGTNESVDKPFWHGESTVGIKGPFGSVQLGRRMDPIYNDDWHFDPWANFDRIASPAWDVWHYNFPSDPRGNNGQPEYGRLNNGIFYDSPSLGGFSFHLSTSRETTAGDRNKPRTGAVLYRNGFFTGMLAHGKNSAGNTDTFIGLKGTFSALAVMGAYEVGKADGAKAKSATLGVSYALGRTTLRAGWGQLDLDGTKARRMIGLGALYSLSGRTGVYVDFGRKKRPERSASTYGVGIAHMF